MPQARFQKEFEEEEARAAHEAASRAAAAKKVVKPSTAAPPPSLKPAFGVLPQYPTAPSPSQASPVRAPSYPDLSSLPPMSPHMPSPSDAFHHPSSAPALHHHQHPAGPHDHDHSSSAFDAPPTLPPKPAHISSMDDLYFAGAPFLSYLRINAKLFFGAGNDLPVLPPKPTELRFSSPLDHSLAPTIPPKPAGMRRESTDGVCGTYFGAVHPMLIAAQTFATLLFRAICCLRSSSWRTRRRSAISRRAAFCAANWCALSFVLSCSDAGAQLDGVLVVSHLLLPQQTGTSDSCSTTHEEEIMVFQEEHGVDAFGWIHVRFFVSIIMLTYRRQTHPSQRCFMSSVDLHTHCFYQLMLPEAIAIVCAPKSDPEYAHFLLFSLCANARSVVGACSG